MAESVDQKAEVAKALSGIAAEGQKFMNDESGSREKLIESARKLLIATEDPFETILWTIWAQPTRTLATRIAVDLKIFETAVQDGGRPKTVAELAAPTGASPKLVQRIARTCVTMNMLGVAGPGLYEPNNLTRTLMLPECADGIIFSFDALQSSFTKLPEYLRNTNFQNPSDRTDGPFQYANDPKVPFNRWLAENPKLFKAFHGYIHALRKHRPRWTEMYPVQERLVDGLKPDGDASVLVDIGGGTGFILQDFQTAVPEYTGRLVLQEQPHVINEAKKRGLEPRIELCTHDFFTPQPIKGARAYFMRSVLHDWTDDACRKILGHLKDALEPGYSRILIDDYVVADDHAAWQHVSLDLIVMAIVSAHERTESEWRELIESCGLKIAGIYSKGQGNESVIEVVV